MKTPSRLVRPDPLAQEIGIDAVHHCDACHLHAGPKRRFDQRTLAAAAVDAATIALMSSTWSATIGSARAIMVSTFHQREHHLSRLRHRSPDGDWRTVTIAATGLTVLFLPALYAAWNRIRPDTPAAPPTRDALT